MHSCNLKNMNGPPAHRLSFGGSLIRPEATGYGLVYFAQELLEAKEDSLKVLASLLLF